MKGILKIFVLATLVVMAPMVLAEDVSGGLRYSITVTEFENRSGWSGYWSLGDAWDTVLTDMLNQTGRFIVLGESEMRAAAMNEQDYAASGSTAGGQKAPVTGQMTPAQLLVKGVITHVQHYTGSKGGGLRYKGFNIDGGGEKGEVNATLYIVDSSTGQVVASTSVVGTHKRSSMDVGYATGDWGASFGGDKADSVGLAVQDAVANAVAFMLDQLPGIAWTGSVALIKGDRVYLNRGAREGVSTGQVFSVGDVEVIRDPNTGEILDESIIEIARLSVDTVREKISIAKVISGNASELKIGMGFQQP